VLTVRIANMTAIISLSLAVCPVDAGITILEDLRRTTSWAESWSGGNRSYDAPDTATHPEFGGSGLIITGGFASWDGAIASGQSWERSLIGLGGRIESRGRSIGHTITNNDPVDQQSATIFSEVHYELTFRINQSALATYDAWVEGDATVALYDALGAVVFSGQGMFEQTLQAGEYRLLAKAPLFIESVQYDGAIYDGSDYFVSLHVPAPTPTVLAAIALTITRRRS